MVGVVGLIQPFLTTSSVTREDSPVLSTYDAVKVVVDRSRSQMGTVRKHDWIAADSAKFLDLFFREPRICSCIETISSIHYLRLKICYIKLTG